MSIKLLQFLSFAVEIALLRISIGKSNLAKTQPGFGQTNCSQKRSNWSIWLTNCCSPDWESQSDVRLLEQRFGPHLCRTLRKRTKVMIHFGVDTFDTMEAVCSGLNRALRLLNFDAVFNNFWSSYAALKINIDIIC